MPNAATPARRTSIETVKCSAKYLSRNATPKNTMTTPMRVSALAPVSQLHNAFARGDGGRIGPCAVTGGGGAVAGSAGEAAGDTSGTCIDSGACPRDGEGSGTF